MECRSRIKSNFPIYRDISGGGPLGGSDRSEIGEPRDAGGLSLWQKGLWRAKTYSGAFAIRSRGQYCKAHWGQA